VRDGAAGIAPDWNFALSCADTPYVTIAHQDDVYYPDYAQNVIAYMEASRAQGAEPLIAFTDYAELKQGQAQTGSVNLRIKRILLAPLCADYVRSQRDSGQMHGKRGNSRFWKRFGLRFGNAICCPSVTYYMPAIGKNYLHLQDSEMPDASNALARDLFDSGLRSNLDWELWERLSLVEGSFLYLPEILMAHRIHEASETSATIAEHMRRGEDYEMFAKFWPKWVARILSGAYGASEKGNRV
jgi:hypothetical protein